MRRALAAAILSLATVTPTFAADAADAVPAADASQVGRGTAAMAVDRLPTFSTAVMGGRRPTALMPLYAASFALQGYDTYSTLSALKAGGRETNPVMQSVVGSPVAFTAVKVGTAAATLLLSERLWKSHHRTAAIAVMTVSNLGMTMVAMNNARVLATLR